MTPPSSVPSGNPSSLTLHLLSGKTTQITPPSTENDVQYPRPATENGYVSQPVPASCTAQQGPLHVETSSSKSLSTDNRGIYEGAGELHPWEDGIDPDVARIQYDEELSPLYLQAST